MFVNAVGFDGTIVENISSIKLLTSTYVKCGSLIYIYIDTYFYACDAPNLHRQFTFSFAKKSFELWTDLTRIRSNCLVSQYLGIERSSQS